jgi:type I restriction enzyme S subunit
MNNDWIEVELGEVCEINMGQSPPSSSYNYDRNGLPFFQGKAEFTELYPEVKKWCDTPKKVASINDILISVRAPVGATNLANQVCAIGRGLAAISYPKCYKYIFYYLRFIEQLLDAKGTGSTFKAISGSILRSQTIPLAPLPEQRAIVAKIEQLFSELDNGIQNLKTAQRKLTLYRQAVLKKAFEGGFTEQWRKEQEKLPTAGELLAEIEEERESYHLHQVEKWKQGIKRWEENGKVEKKPSKPSKLTIPTKPSNEHLDRTWEIPKNWVWTQLGNFCFVTKLAGFEYTEYIDYNDLGDLPVIKAENAGINGFKKTDYSKVESVSVKSLTRSELFGGELLVVFVGAGTGNVAVVPNDKKYFLGPNIAMAKPYLKVNTKYVEYFLRSSFGKNLILAAVKAVAQPSLSMETIRQVPIAFTSLTEQHQIVQEIESRLSVCDKVQETINQNLQKAEALRQSILKKAFAGNLLTQQELTACRNEPDYAPASELLKEIVN